MPERRNSLKATDMLKRKLEETASILYRKLAFPFKRMAVELRTDSIMKQGSYLNKGTALEGRNYIGKGTVLSNVRLGFGSYVSDGGDISNAKIGRYTSIGPGAETVLGTHPIDNKRAALHPAFYSKTAAMGFSYAVPEEEEFEEEVYIDKALGIQVVIGNDVWIGQGVRILEGVTIGDGAVVGAGALVAGDLEPYGIYAGVPARKIRDRFDGAVIKELLEYKWWERDEAWIKAHAKDFSDVSALIRALKEA